MREYPCGVSAFSGSGTPSVEWKEAAEDASDPRRCSVRTRPTQHTAGFWTGRVGTQWVGTQIEMKLPISVYLVSGAEADRIGPALESVTPWAAEVVVVLNQEVADETENIALSHGAEVYREPWKGFIAQKNSALAKTTMPWSLNLDADERVSDALQAEIRAKVTSNDSRFSAYSFPRCTHFLGRWIRHGDWYPDRVTRLARNGAIVWSGIEPHAAPTVVGRTGKLKSDLLHLSNESIDRMIGKLSAYSEAFAIAAVASKRKVGWVDFAFRPWWRFVRGYLLRLGFLDGIPGYQIAWYNAYMVMSRYSKLYERSGNSMAAAKTLPPFRQSAAPTTITTGAHGKGDGR